MPINITRLPSGALLLQRDSTEIIVDAAAVGGALSIIIAALVDGGRALGAARTAGYEAGLIVGHANGVRETEARYRHTEDMIDALAAAVGGLASAA